MVGTAPKSIKSSLAEPLAMILAKLGILPKSTYFLAKRGSRASTPSTKIFSVSALRSIKNTLLYNYQ